MRTCRMGLIQTADQLRFSYLAIIEGGHRILASEESTLSVLDSYIHEVRYLENLCCPKKQMFKHFKECFCRNKKVRKSSPELLEKIPFIV